jgi:hypothetical protein
MQYADIIVIEDPTGKIVLWDILEFELNPKEFLRISEEVSKITQCNEEKEYILLLCNPPFNARVTICSINKSEVLLKDLFERIKKMN